MCQTVAFILHMMLKLQQVLQQFIDLAEEVANEKV